MFYIETETQFEFLSNQKKTEIFRLQWVIRAFIRDRYIKINSIRRAVNHTFENHLSCCPNFWATRYSLVATQVSF